MKGCFLCRENNMARQHQSKDEVANAIERVKSRRPIALLTVQDLAAVCDMMRSENEGDEDELSDWASVG